MKKLIVLMVLVAGMVACKQETELSDLKVAENELRTENRSTSLLLDYKRFSVAYSKAVDQLKIERERLSESADISSLQHKEGMLAINSEKEFRPVYESIVNADTLWQNVYENEINELVSIAKENGEILEYFGDGDEISWEIEDLLKADAIGFYDLQSNIAAKMPVNTLWAKVRNESIEWLDQQGESPNWEKDPDNANALDAYGRLFVNEESSIIILGEVRYAEGEVSINNNTKGKTAGRTLGADGCRTFRMCTEFTDDNGSNTCLRTRVYVNNFWLWRSFGANGKGWVRRNGRWRERRFGKVLTMGGTFIAHRAGLAVACDPFFAQQSNRNRSSNAVEYSINETIWNAYMGLCRNNFAATLAGRGRAQGVVMD